MLFNVAVDERSDVARSSARLVGGLRYGEPVKKLVENLDRLLVLGLRVGGVRGYSLHDVESRHYDKVEVLYV